MFLYYPEKEENLLPFSGQHRATFFGGFHTWIQSFFYWINGAEMVKRYSARYRQGLNMTVKHFWRFYHWIRWIQINLIQIYIAVPKTGPKTDRPFLWHQLWFCTNWVSSSPEKLTAQKDNRNKGMNWVFLESLFSWQARYRAFLKLKY